MNIKTIINSFLKKHRYNGSKSGYEKLYKRIIKLNNINVNGLNQKEINNWLTKWQKYDSKLSPLSYQVFSHYVGYDINIIPDAILAGIVEPVLTPERFQAQYSDKNNMDSVFYGLKMPKTLLRNIDGIFYDYSYRNIERPLFFMEQPEKPEKIVLKPSREASGRGVKLYILKGEQYLDSEGLPLTMDYLDSKYKTNYLIQEAVSQSPYMSQFNDTSVNTLRIATYRSVKTGSVHVINAVMRIGASGSNVDNAHSGGVFIGINKENGELGKYVCNWLGHKETSFNGIEFSKNNYNIPCWDEICGFAKQVSDRILFGNIVALDIAVDKQGYPVLIETNIGGFSGWLFQFTTGTVFGEYTDEVMNYCWEKYKTIEASIML